MNATTDSGKRSARRAAAMATLGAYILFSPFFVQVLKFDLPFVRPWIMFRDVGLGVLKGEFSYTDETGETMRLAPLDVAQLSRYPLNEQFYRFDRLVLNDEQFSRFVAGFCAKHPDGRLSYAGKVGAGRSWRAVELTDLCRGAVE